MSRSPDGAGAGAGAHSIGYANEPGKPERLSEAGAGAIINSLADLALKFRARVVDSVVDPGMAPGDGP